MDEQMKTGETGDKNAVIDQKLRQFFDGKIVRKDLTKKIKEGANVPVYVLEFLLGQYCSSDDPEVIEIGAKGLMITSLMYVGLGTIYLLRGMLNGVGDATFSMMNGVIEVIGRVGFAQLFMLIPGIGMWGIWWTNGMTWALTGSMNIIRVKQGRWKTKTVVEKVN